MAADDDAGHWVLEDDDGRVVGIAGAHETAVAGVLSLGVALVPEARGRGHGKALVESILAHAIDTGAHKVALEVWPDNEPAIRLHKSLGFVVEGVRRNHYRRRDGVLRSAVFMATLLHPAEDADVNASCDPPPDGSQAAESAGAPAKPRAGRSSAQSG